MQFSRVGVAFVLAALVLPSGAVSAKVADVTLNELVAESEVIVVGQIVEVRSVEGVRVARVHVEESIKGAPGLDLWFLAQGTWTCDITWGEVDDRAILFLGQYQFDPNPQDETQEADDLIAIGEFNEPAGFKQRIFDVTAGRTFWAVSWDGRGQMTLRRKQGIEFAEVWTAEVVLPDRLLASARKAKYQSERLVRAQELLDAIRYHIGAATSN